MLNMMHHTLSIFALHPFVLYLFIVLFGLIAGSLLSVINYRLPIIIQSLWQNEYRAYLNDQSFTAKKISFSLLLTPRSLCSNCQTAIPWYHGVPPLNCLLRFRRCPSCNTYRSFLYPSTTLITVILSICITHHFGISHQLLPALAFTYTLISLSVIDGKHYFLPDQITLPMIWLGLLLNCFTLFISPSYAIFGAIFGYLFLWITANIFQLIRKKQGMGNGDFKLLALIGAWLGPYAILNGLLLAFMLALLTSVSLLMLKKITFATQIPFGPFLAISGWLTLMFGPFLLRSLTLYLF